MPHRTSGEPMTPEQALKRQVLINKSHLYTLLALLVLIGVTVGYAGARIETSQIFLWQEARHVNEIMQLRDDNSQDSREARQMMGQAVEATVVAAHATREAAGQLKAMADELGPEQTRAARRAKDASNRAQEASAKAEAAARVAQESELRVGRIMAPAEPHRRIDPK